MASFLCSFMTKSEIGGGERDHHLRRLSRSILHDFDIRQMQMWGQYYKIQNDQRRQGHLRHGKTKKLLGETKATWQQNEMW